MKNTAPQDSNSVNGREKYFKTVNFKSQVMKWSHGSVVWGLTFYAEWSSGAGSKPSAELIPIFRFFFSFIVFLPFALFLFFLTADPF